MSDTESDTECEVGGCGAYMREWSDCCHVPLCTDHYDELMKPTCYVEDCSEHDILMCTLCLERNSRLYHYCSVCKKALCDEHNVNRHKCSC